jgi:ParB family chromosome partitioning protein
MLDLNADITNLRGATYNPRRIDDATLDVLAESIRRLGIVKPLIARNDLLVAGHQRCRTLRRMGIDRAPVYRLPKNTTTYDETRFNQLHNGTDMDSGDEDCRITGGFTAHGFQTVAPARIEGNFKARGAAVRKEIADLITGFGPWGCSVVTADGRVIHCAQYALAAKITRTPLTVFVIEPGREGEYADFLGKTYGVFSYAHLEKHTYVQAYAQMFRLRDGESGKSLKSTLYENFVLPYMAAHKQESGIDFGSGQGDYARLLRAHGHDLHDVELFRRVGGAKAVDVGAVNRMVDAMIRHLDARGRYDFVVCDSVMNSVDSLDAERAVMAWLNVLCKVGGRVFFSGRSLEDARAAYDRRVQADRRLRIDFLDEHGFSGLYREGNWFYQKYHSKEQVESLVARFGMCIIQHTRQGNVWRVEAVKQAHVSREEAEFAAAFEFNLPLGRERRLGRHDDVNAMVRRLYDAGS